MTLSEIDPLLDCRWVDLTERCVRSSIFHTPEWLAALRRTYGYKSVVFTDSRSGEPLRNGLLFCHVDSWLTGKRLVALPFSDHCEPLLDTPDVLATFLESLKGRVGRDCQYIELRPLETAIDVPGFTRSAAFCAHWIDLRPDLEAIFRGFHKNHARRAIRKAERSGHVVEVGRSNELLEQFYALHTMTRRRHGVPVQPFDWFRNLRDCLGERLTIFMARYQDQPAATILTVRHRKTLVFKYGCLDPVYKRYGGTPQLFWRAIQNAKEQGLTVFDLGRSDVDNPGLIAFKDHLGAQRQALNYYRYSTHPRRGWVSTLGSAAFTLAPASVQAALSGRLYKHFG